MPQQRRQQRQRPRRPRRRQKRAPRNGGSNSQRDLGDRGRKPQQQSLTWHGTTVKSRAPPPHIPPLPRRTLGQPRLNKNKKHHPIETQAPETQPRKMVSNRTSQIGSSHMRTPSQRAQPSRATSSSWISTPRTKRAPRRPKRPTPAREKRQLQEQEMPKMQGRRAPDEGGASNPTTSSTTTSPSLQSPTRITTETNSLSIYYTL